MGSIRNNPWPKDFNKDSEVKEEKARLKSSNLEKACNLKTLSHHPIFQEKSNDVKSSRKGNGMKTEKLKSLEFLRLKSSCKSKQINPSSSLSNIDEAVGDSANQRNAQWNFNDRANVSASSALLKSKEEYDSKIDTLAESSINKNAGFKYAKVASLPSLCYFGSSGQTNKPISGNKKYPYGEINIIALSESYSKVKLTKAIQPLRRQSSKNALKSENDFSATTDKIMAQPRRQSCSNIFIPKNIWSRTAHETIMQLKIRNSDTPGSEKRWFSTTNTSMV